MTFEKNNIEGNKIAYCSSKRPERSYGLTDDNFYRMKACLYLLKSIYTNIHINLFSAKCNQNQKQDHMSYAPGL